ncbi:ParA family protein [Sinorhizobium meliloti WSM1022]|uniref:CobQ/CobB/MinD/ParA nucleotide binding domain-containing protein n=6 Tax=Sinorhizobium TaxID=28105 RepID=Q92NJ2_RHIME|nr:MULTISPECIES: ParA family protein [Sinorhizobium]PND23711.1 ParA family protein [Ensifer sp. MMN_5]PST25203.1 ParA family protein [Mesorhizobium loti]GCA51247.1 chromosome-partitioning ATPase Soj [Sinorhizobium sp. KGO-5]AEG04939.1 Cobyrinic acid ac-diamide synthase [Sinorhizobium meliloti BL225C]AEG53910.1 Cobyrinic acid ac-diamide synthase [Sinorhizobium meliloti AK83]
MAVITFANAKGGAGKTTAALILSTELARQGNRVVVLDADPQRWITSWSEVSGRVANLEVISHVTPASLPCHIRELKGEADFIVIDLAGAKDAIVALALGLSDHVLIPVQGCAMDARGAVQILELIRHIGEKARVRINHSVVLTRVNSLVTTRALQTIKALLASRGVSVLDTPIVERVAYREIFECGGTLQMMDPNRVSNLDKARENAYALAAEVQNLLPVTARRALMSRLRSALPRAA